MSDDGRIVDDVTLRRQNDVSGISRALNFNNDFRKSIPYAWGGD